MKVDEENQNSSPTGEDASDVSYTDSVSEAEEDSSDDEKDRPSLTPEEKLEMKQKGWTFLGFGMGPVVFLGAF